MLCRRETCERLGTRSREGRIDVSLAARAWLWSPRVPFAVAVRATFASDDIVGIGINTWCEQQTTGHYCTSSDGTGCLTEMVWIRKHV